MSKRMRFRVVADCIGSLPLAPGQQQPSEIRVAAYGNTYESARQKIKKFILKKPWVWVRDSEQAMQSSEDDSEG